MLRFFSGALALAAAFSSHGCYLFHTVGPGEPIDDGGRPLVDAVASPDVRRAPDAPDAPDAPPPPLDAGPPIRGEGWTLHVPGYSLLVGTACRHPSTSETWITVESYPYDVCEHGGPVDVARDDAARRIVVTPWHWRHPGESGREPCLGITAQYRTAVSLGELAPGEWTVVNAHTDATITLVVDASSGDVCGEPCANNRTYYEPTLLEVDCAPGEQCRASGAVSSCASVGTDACTSDDACALEMTCSGAPGSRTCAFRAGLLERAGLPCRDDRTCAPGLRCVDDGGDRFTTCELPCFSNTMRCPDGARCSGDSAVSPRWVCR